MILEPKLLDPIILKLSAFENVMISKEESLPLEVGVMFDKEHYGFTLVVDYDSKETETTYATQCRIVGVQIIDSSLNIYEENKYIPWRFNKRTGALLNRAVFSNLKHSEKDYLRETYGVVDNEGLDEINSYKK